MNPRTGLVHLHDNEEFPVEDVRNTLRKFGSQHNLISSCVLARALGIPQGTFDTILYATKAKAVKGKTKRLIEERIRSYDPSICPEKMVNQAVLSKYLNDFKNEFNLTTTQLAEITEVPRTTLGGWLSGVRISDYRAKKVRPVLIKLKEYRVNKAQQTSKAIQEQARYPQKGLKKRSSLKV